jgi:hypothetical protein
MRFQRCTKTLILCLLCAAALSAQTLLAQKDKREPLTSAEIEQIREAGIDPDARITLYDKFLNEHAATIKALVPRAKTSARGLRVDEELQDFTALMDEAGSNLDVYSDRHADLRKALKKLTESTPKWLEILRSLSSQPAFEISLKEAVESLQDLTTQADQMLVLQTEYFKIHKDEKGQERAEPK